MKTNKCKNLNLMKISNSKQYFWDLAHLRRRYDSLTPVVEFTLDLYDNFTNVVRATLFVNNLRLSYSCRTTGVRAISVVRPFVNSPTQWIRMFGQTHVA